MVKISQGVHYVVDGKAVLVKSGEAVSRLAGPDVEEILIPILPLLENGVELADLVSKKLYDQQKLLEVIEKLVRVGYLAATEFDCRHTGVSGHQEGSLAFQLEVYNCRNLSEELRLIQDDTISNWSIIDVDASNADFDRKVDLAIVVNSDMMGKEALRLNRELYKKGIPFINVSVGVDHLIQVGPYVATGIACLECHNARRTANLTYAYENKLFQTASKVYSSKDELHIAPHEAMFLAAILFEQCKAILNKPDIFQSPLQERIITFNLRTLLVISEDFFRNPRCQVCADSNDGTTEVKQWSVNPFIDEEI